MATERAWDPDRPGCAFEECGGMSLDPCVTIMRTRGRWHDGEVPETAIAVLCTPNGEFEPFDDEQDAARILAAVADWLRAKEGARDNRAADLLDPGRPQ
jgi:hypothetical protein